MNFIRKILFKFLKKIGLTAIFFKGAEKTYFGVTAVKATDGFWYVGDIFDTADIAYGILVNGEIEKEDTELVKKIIGFIAAKKTTKNVEFYDIGANTGYYGIMTSFNSKSTVGATFFEPLSEHVEIIKENIKINNLSNTSIKQVALSDTSGKMNFYKAGSGSTLIKDFSQGTISGEVVVDVVTLDILAKRENLPLPDFVKIDVEGNELAVLEGGRSTIDNAKPVLFIEIVKDLHHINNKFVNKNFNKTFDLLDKLGYQPFVLSSGAVTPLSARDSLQGLNMVLFLHLENHKELKQFLLK